MNSDAHCPAKRVYRRNYGRNQSREPKQTHAQISNITGNSPVVVTDLQKLIAKRRDILMKRRSYSTPKHSWGQYDGISHGAGEDLEYSDFPTDPIEKSILEETLDWLKRYIWSLKVLTGDKSSRRNDIDYYEVIWGISANVYNAHRFGIRWVNSARVLNVSMLLELIYDSLMRMGLGIENSVWLYDRLCERIVGGMW